MASEPLQSEKHDSTANDTHISRAVVEAKLATAAEVAACAKKLEELKAAGKVYRLSDVLVKAGVVTPSQLKRLANPADDSGLGKPNLQIPGFQIMQKVGAGAMASVYKAKQLSLDRIVAIKILPKRLSEDPEFVVRFNKEGRAAAKLNHNNIVQAIDVGEYGGYHYFVMEFIDGKTVYDELIKNRVYAEKDALDIAIQIARALEHAHARGFIHRDVKPKNIMITKDGTAKLADMGLAREASDAAAAEAEKGRAYGTPYYISPEQVRGELTTDFRADIYSLGATLYHMVTGRVPFEGTTPAQIMQKHLKEKLIPPDHLNSKLSTGLAEVVERAMAKNRDIRYATTTDLLVDLDRVRRGDPPLQARVGLNRNLLANLAAGDEDAEFQSSVQLGLSADGTAPQRGSVTTPLLSVAVVAEFIVILVLIAVLMSR